MSSIKEQYNPSRPRSPTGFYKPYQTFYQAFYQAFYRPFHRCSGPVMPVERWRICRYSAGAQQRVNGGRRGLMGTVSTRLRRIASATPPRPSETTPSPATQGATGSRRRIAAILLGAGAVLLLLPVGLYFWFVYRYGVNAIYYDQWENIGLLTHTRYLFNSYSHTTVAMLWAQHGEDRMFLPNLVVLALGRLTNMNIMTELYISGTLLVLAFTLIIVAHRQDVPRTRLVLYVPAAFLVLTFGLIENTLFGFNLWLYMVIAALASTIFLLDLERGAGSFSPRPSRRPSWGATPVSMDSRSGRRVWSFCSGGVVLDGSC